MEPCQLAFTGMYSSDPTAHFPIGWLADMASSTHGKVEETPVPRLGFRKVQCCCFCRQAHSGAESLHGVRTHGHPQPPLTG